MSSPLVRRKAISGWAHANRIEPREHRIGFHPFTPGELHERLVAGLREVHTDFDDGRGRYAVTVVRLPH